MLNYLWAFLILIGVAVGVVTGDATDVNTALIDGSKEAVSLCITMLGIMAFWTGLMEIAKDSGLISFLTKKLQFLFRILFPDLPRDHVANQYIASNIIANMLGLGWAATPMGIKAMQKLAAFETEKNGGVSTGIASVNMCTFLILNISSLQLIPVNIIAYRSQYGSVHPTSIIAPALVATCCSTVAGVMFALIARKLTNQKQSR